ncbi:unnamed protein product [Periconia digitata]|uniref:EamA domain-containing protein n=1 Tax=Periconia digitata TaxID=1303443 RepID=A0A9W4XUJ4_9PLEO|nr:unnamed protein product [Periconia digitata]
MTVPPPPATSKNHDKHDVVIAADSTEPHGLPVKSGGDSLHVVSSFSGAIRVPSPDPSLLSVDDGGRWGRNVASLPLSRYASRHHVSRSPAPPQRPRTWKGKVEVFWTKNKGLAMVLFSQLFGTLMNVTTRMLEIEGNDGQGFHPFQVLFARMSITVMCSTFYMWRTKTEHFPFGMKEVRPLLIARGLTGFFGVFGMYYSLLYLPLADATVITFLAPSLACWACSYLINEPFTRMEQIAAYISLFGVILIARPLSFFSFVSESKKDADSLPTIPTNATVAPLPHLASDYDAVTPAQRAAGVGVAMLGVLGAAGAYTTIRWIGKRAHPLLSVNYFAVWCTIVSLVMMFALPGVGFLLPRSLKDWTYLVFLGICGFVMQFLLAAGLQYEKSSRATNMVYCQMLFALAFDKLVFGTTPSALSILGSSLILGSAIYVALHKSDAAGKESMSREVVPGGRFEEEMGLIETSRDDGRETAGDDDDDDDEHHHRESRSAAPP